MRATNLLAEQNTLYLNAQDYPGGVAIWGALPPIIDTKKEMIDKGVHVHARVSANAKKSIDSTYEYVTVKHLDQTFTISEELAVNFSLSSIFNHNIQSLECNSCGEMVIDKGLLALMPHHEHICQNCGKVNFTKEACVVNPIIYLKSIFNDSNVQRPSTVPVRSLMIVNGSFKGGIQIWGSNPSILWTATRQEESAIHVHAYNETGKRIVDNTYGEVTLYGTKLDIEMVRYLQIQLFISEIKQHLSIVSCPYCSSLQFDKGIYAVIPHVNRVCQACKNSFNSQCAISNPLVNVIKEVHNVSCIA